MKLVYVDEIEPSVGMLVSHLLHQIMKEKEAGKFKETHTLFWKGEEVIIDLKKIKAKK